MGVTLTCSSLLSKTKVNHVFLQIDLRFSNKDQGSLAVVVAPLLRFIDVGFNADVRIEEVGPPDKLISGFAPELFGSPLAVSTTQFLRDLPIIHFTMPQCLVQ